MDHYVAIFSNKAIGMPFKKPEWYTFSFLAIQYVRIKYFLVNFSVRWADILTFHSVCDPCELEREISVFHWIFLFSGLLSKPLLGYEYLFAKLRPTHPPYFFLFSAIMNNRLQVSWHVVHQARWYFCYYYNCRSNIIEVLLRQGG